MRLLITGGAGCLGSNIAEYYLPRGYDICVLDNFATGRRGVLASGPGLRVIEGSICNQDLVDDLFREFEPTHVVHSAAAYKDPKDWIEDASTNVLGSITVANAAREHGVERLVNFQTALCYGRPNQSPIPITHQCSPFTSYGISKTAAESYLLHSGLHVTSLRLANICGPRLSIGPIPTFYKRLRAGKSCYCSNAERDFLDMSDFLSLMDRVLAPDSPCGVFNVSTGVGHSIKDIYDAVSRYLDIESNEVPIVPVGDDDIQRVILDPSTTKTAFSWEPAVDFETTIRNQLQWYDMHGVDEVYSHLANSDKT